MRHVAIMLALATVVAVAPDVAAQSVVGPGTGASLEKARSSIKEGRRAGQLTRREARELRRQTGRVDDLAERQAIGGTSDSERRFAESAAAAMSGLVDASRQRGPR